MRHIIIIFIALIFIASVPINEKSIRIVYPNGGEKLYTNSSLWIKWEFGEKQERVVIILYENGIKNVTIAEGIVNSGSYLWKIPAKFPTGKNFRLRIRWLNNLSINDFSDFDFEIANKE